MRRQLGHAADDPDAAPVVEVLPCNWRTVLVFEACQFSREPVFTGTGLRWIYHGIAASEIAAAMAGMAVREKARSRVFRGVRVMAAAALPLLNEK